MSPGPTDDEGGAETVYLDDLRPGPWLAGTLDVNALIAHNDQAALAISGVEAYPDRFGFRIHSYLRSSMPRPEAITMATVTVTGHYAVPIGGGGKPRSWAYEYVVWSPPEQKADVKLVVSWPEYGIPETPFSISGADLAAAGARARPVWPEDAARTSYLTRREAFGDEAD